MCFTVKKLNLLALIVSKFLEILHWLAAALMLCLLALCLAAPNWLSGLLAQGAQRFGRELTTYGFTLTVAGAYGSVNLAAVALFTVGAISILSLMAMVFRNVYLIFRTAKGKTWFAKGDTPFQKDIVRMVREIGIFYLAVPIVSLLMSVVAVLVLGADAAEPSVNFEGVVTGILLLCLSQVFAYGAQLERDVDGLL